MDLELEALLETAFLEGDSTCIINLPYGKSSYQFLVHVTRKIVETINLCSVSLKQNELIVRNVLKILADFIPILREDLEQTIIISECMLRTATDETAPVQIIKRAVYNLNLLLEEDGPVLNWLQNEDSLEGFLLILGRKLPSIGDFECQSCIFETLCKIVYDNENKHNWIQSWFSDDEKTRSTFLNWNLDHFTVESRKILNQINRRELNPRTFAFAATAVYFGNVQLEKLNGLEFWIDFNYDSKSITFFCKDFEIGDQDRDETWETVVITSEDVENYTVQKNKETKSIELCIHLNTSCKDLVMSSNPSFETNLVRMIFWIYVDITYHLKTIFGESKTLFNDHTANSQDTVPVKKVRKISDSDVVKIYDEDFVIKKRRVSDSANLIYLSTDGNNFKAANDLHKSYDPFQRRKISCSSLNLKDSDSEKSFQMNDKNKCAKSKFVKSISNEKYSRGYEKFSYNDSEDGKATKRPNHMEPNAQNIVRKSSDALCGIDFIFEGSDILIVDTNDGEGNFKEISENLSAEKHKVSNKKNLNGQQVVSSGFIEKTYDCNKSSSRIFHQDVGIEESVHNGFVERPSQPDIKGKNELFTGTQIIKNSNELVDLSQNNQSISSAGSCSSQKRVKKLGGSRKISQPFSDEIYAISPTPSNRKKSRNTTIFTPNEKNDVTSLESQSYFKKHDDINEFEMCISNKSVFDENTEGLGKIDSFENKNAQDDTPNRQKKMRLYNINSDPVFDVPPSEQKKTPTQKNSLFIDLSVKKQNKSLLQNSLPLSDDEFCETKFLSKNTIDSVETDKKHIINNNILETNKKEENELSKNNILAKGQIEDLEVKPSKQETSENEHLSNKDSTIGESRKKRIKKSNEKVGKKESSTSNLLKRKLNAVDKENISEEASPKKKRKAAIKAMKKNKNLFKQKEVEDFAKAFDEISIHINHSNDEFEVKNTPPTKSVKKHRFKSIFKSDTETGSSNVSWIGGKHSRLFDTPPKNYINSKTKLSSKSTSLKKGKNVSNVAKSKRRNSNLSLGSFEIKSKSGLSDLENYELVVETKAGNKKSSFLSRKPITFEKVSKAINAAVETYAEKAKFQNKLNNEPSNIDFELEMDGNITDFYHNGGLERDGSIGEDLTNVGREDFQSNIIDISDINQIKTKHTLKKRHSSGNKFSLEEKENLTGFELHQKTVSNNLPSSSLKKRKPANISESIEKSKRNKRDSHNVNMNSGDFPAQDLITFDETSQNFQSTCSAQNLEDSKIPEKLQNSSGSESEKLSESHHYSAYLSPKIGILTEESLSSLSKGERNTKDLHIERYLKGLSDESNSPNNFQHSDKVDQTFDFVSYKTSKPNKSSRSDNLMKHTNSENCLSEEVKISELSSIKNYSDVKKNHFTSFGETIEKSKARSERNLQKFSAINNHEDSGSIQEEFLEKCRKEDNRIENFKHKRRQPSKQLSILRLLSVEMDNMTRRLLRTLQMRFYDFNIKISASREKVLAAASALISKENDWQHKDLEKLARESKLNRINAEKSLKKILNTGHGYFEAEKAHSQRRKRLHRKALKKYAARIKLAGRYAVEALENKAAAKTELLLQSILRKLEHLL